MLSLGLPILPSANPIIQHGGLIDRLCTMSLITIRLCMVAYLLLLGTVLVVLIGCIAGYTSLLGVISLSIGLAHSFAAMLEDFERDYANVKHRLASTTRRLVFVLRLLLYYLAFVTTFNIMFGTAYGALQWNNDRLKGLNGDYDSLAFNIGRGIAIYANEWAVIHVYIAKKAVEGISYTFKEVVEGSQKGWKFSVWI
ncbi:hypothetical protein SLS60_002444 [Paraconiothyrium brasiliense]|uniref:Uncharacterized protein n=1 Tax=Paraconiothyrium brasiliense TaxID=300254 RepID=A0ABR3S2P8_9PLEO